MIYSADTLHIFLCHYLAMHYEQLAQKIRENVFLSTIIERQEVDQVHLCWIDCIVLCNSFWQLASVAHWSRRFYQMTMGTVSQDIPVNESMGSGFEMIEPVFPTGYEHMNWSNVRGDRSAARNL